MSVGKEGTDFTIVTKSLTPATGHIYIGDRNNHHIKILNSDLTVFHLIGSAEAIDIQGFLYVAVTYFEVHS